ncbi:UDP binding domain-containing protein [Pedobacter deserti]|uniref:UDP binding domain-containing protein n=1 Tax=Pedobacter deserti TaxID=2817382 RepID=UPI00210F1FB9
MKVFKDPYRACENAHAIAILTEWDEFKDYDWQRIYDNMKKPAKIFDGRNILDAEKLRAIGFKVNAIGVN